MLFMMVTAMIKLSPEVHHLDIIINCDQIVTTSFYQTGVEGSCHCYLKSESHLVLVAVANVATMHIHAHNTETVEVSDVLN
jgi:hypothetical protein